MDTSNSTSQSAKTNEGDRELLTIDLPGHPLHGQTLEVIGTFRQNGYLMLRRTDGVGVPLSLSSLNFGILDGRGTLKIEGLLEIARLVAVAQRKDVQEGDS